MKIHLFLFVFMYSWSSYAQKSFHVHDKKFEQQFSEIFHSAGNGFQEIRGREIRSEGRVEGYQLMLRPTGATEIVNISRKREGVFSLFFKLGSYSGDLSEVRQRFDDMVSLVTTLGAGQLQMQEDSSFMDTKIRSVVFCKKGSTDCLNDFVVGLFFHKKFNNTYNVSVIVQGHEK